MKFLIITLIFLIGCTTTTPAPDTNTPTATPTPTPVTTAPKPADLKPIEEMVAGSSCAKVNWKERGIPHVGYIKGMTAMFADALCNPNRADVKVIGSARSTRSGDVLNHYGAKLTALGIKTDKASPDNIRAVYAILMGLGMRESNGRFCAGRDLSANFVEANEAEAGLFQVSWNVSVVDPAIAAMFKEYEAGQRGCYVDVFKEGWATTGTYGYTNYCATNAKNWGDAGSRGYQYQQYVKKCPAFSAQYAAVVLRYSGGPSGHFGPIRDRAAEVRTECNDLLLKIQNLVKEKPELCKLL
jgi:hypothetical protein